MMKPRHMILALFAVAVVSASALPASAQASRDRTCSLSEGAVSVTYDCDFKIKEYVLGTPVTFAINYNCAGNCGPVMSFGLRDGGFSPAGVSGHMTGGRRLSSGLELTFVFDSLRKTGNHSMGNAHFVMTMMVDDGAGGLMALPLPIDVRLKETTD